MISVWSLDVHIPAGPLRLPAAAVVLCVMMLSCAPRPISDPPAHQSPALSPEPAGSVPAPEKGPNVVTLSPAPVPSATSPATYQAIEQPSRVPATALATTPEPTPTPAVWPTVTRQVLPAETAAGLAPCARRDVDDTDLLLFVTQQFGLPETYIPSDLVPLSDYVSSGVTVGIDSYVRAGLIEPLRRLIEDMQAAGLAPSILSGYRSYGEQYLAWKWWNSQYPERVAIMSARAGHSEHQLGTTVDFGSPALDHLFHVDFATTPEGLWLADNAHRYGFTMSYPADTYEITGFKYEPWHYRYVGVDPATDLYATDGILTEWQLENLPPPCIP